MSKNIEVLQAICSQLEGVNESREDLMALRAAIELFKMVEVDAGWVLVPREATSEMVRATANIDGIEYVHPNLIYNSMVNAPSSEVLSTWPVYHVTGLHDLVAALEKADQKGYLADAIRAAWEDFDYLEAQSG